MNREDAADWFDATMQMPERAYRRHSPDHQGRALAIMERRRRCCARNCAVRRRPYR
jgi:hypothetical protein